MALRSDFADGITGKQPSQSHTSVTRDNGDATGLPGNSGFRLRVLRAGKQKVGVSYAGALRSTLGAAPHPPAGFLSA